MSMQCGEAGQTGGTGGTRLGPRKAGREGNEAPGDGARRSRPRVSRKELDGALVARWTQWRRAPEAGAADTRQDEGAAKRVRGAHEDNPNHNLGGVRGQGQDRQLLAHRAVGRLGMGSSTLRLG